MSETFRSAGGAGRDNWAIQMQTLYAIPVYAKYWRVDEAEILEVDQCRQTEKTAQILDSDGGTDKVVRPETGIRHIAQRFRTQDEKYGNPDFSIRTSTYSGVETEYDKLMNAYRNNGNIPAIYSFGIGAGVTQSECLQRGFAAVHFIDLPSFLNRVDNNDIEAIGRFRNGDGSEALYYNIDQLRRYGVINDSIHGDVLSSAWEDRALSDEFPTAPGIDNTGQLDLMDFGGGD